MKLRNQSYFSRRTFSVFVIATISLMLFASPVAKAQQDSSITFDADFPAQRLPDGGQVVENNLANPDNISTEISLWEQDLGRKITDGSYVGSLFESSVFEMDYKPLQKNDTYTFAGWYHSDANKVDWTTQNYFNDFPEDLTFQRFTETIDTVEKRSTLTVGMVMNFNNRVIMSGATEFWVKIPVQTSSFNFDELTPTFSMFEMNSGETLEDGDLILQDGYSVAYSLYPTRTIWNEDGGNHSLEFGQAGRIMKEFGGHEEIRAEYKGRPATIIQPIQEKYIFGENMYVHVFGAIEPNVNYVVSVSGILSSKPRLYLTEDDIGNNGRRAILQTADLDFVNEEVKYFDTGIEQRDKSVLIVSTDAPFGVLTGKFLELPVDASFSFIFKAGRGDFGMYGQTFDAKAGNSLVFYRDLDFSTINGDKFVSVMIPFVSDKSIVVNLTVELLPIYDRENKFEAQGFLNYNWNIHNETDPSVATSFLYKFPYWWQSEEATSYRDFIMFTVPYKIQYDILSTNIITAKIIVTFVEDAEVNFMFSSIDSSIIHEKIDDYIPLNFDRTYSLTTFGEVPSYKVRKHLTYLHNSVSFEPIVYGGWTYKNEFYTGLSATSLYAWEMRNFIKNPRDVEIIHSELFSSVQLTDGIWHQLVSSSEGYQYATHLFERRVAVGLVEVWVDTTNNETEEARAWYDEASGFYQQAFEMLSEGNILGALSLAVAGTISLIWNGLQAFLGAILGIFVKVWDGLVAVGKFIKSVINSFVGKVLSIVGDIVDNLEKILNPALYIIALLIFMYAIAWSGKLIYNPTGGI